MSGRRTIAGVLVAALGVGVGVGLLLRRVFPAGRTRSTVSLQDDVSPAETGRADGAAHTSPLQNLSAITAEMLARAPAVKTTRRIAPSFVLTVMSICLMALAAYYFRDFSTDAALVYGAAAAMSGGVLLLLARQFGAGGAVSVIPAHQPAAMPVRLLPVMAGAALLAILVAMNADSLATGIFAVVDPTIQFCLMTAGVALVTWGMSGAPPLPLRRWLRLQTRHNARRTRQASPLQDNAVGTTPASSETSERARLPFFQREWVIVAALLAFAALLRLWDIEYSMRFFVDEVHLSTGVAYFWNNYIKLLHPIGELMPFPRLFPYLMNIAVEIFGRNFTGLRFVPIVFGVATVGALYFLARTLYDRTTAVVAALALAAFPPAVHFSRVALINIADPLFGILALAFLARAQRTGQQRDYALSGAMLGMVMYFYAGGRAVFPLLLGVMVGGLLLESVRLRRLRPTIDLTFNLRGLVIVALTAGLVAAPLLLTNYSIGYIKPRIQDAGIAPDLWQTWAQTGNYGEYFYRLRNAFLIYMTLPDTGLYYAGDQPFILSVVAPLFLLGVFQVLLRWRSGAWLPVAWVMLTSLGTSLLEYSTITARYVLVLPALALLIGVGLRYTAPLLAGERWTRRLLTLALLALTVFHVHYYFNIHLPRFNQQFRAGEAPDVHDALLRAATLPPQTTAHLISLHPASDQMYADQVLGFLTGDVTAKIVPLDELNYSYLLRLTCSDPQAFFIERGTATDRAKPLIEQFFPLNPPERSPFPVPFERSMWLYFYDPAARSPDDPRCRPHAQPSS